MRAPDRLAAATASLSFFISTLDRGIVNVTPPQLTRSLQIDAGQAAWTLSAYAAALSIAILPFGQGATFIAVFVCSPFELTRQAQLLAWQVGPVLLATPLAAAIARRGWRALSCSVASGSHRCFFGLTLYGVAAMALLATPASNLALFALLLFFFGFGSHRRVERCPEVTRALRR